MLMVFFNYQYFTLPVTSKLSDQSKWEGGVSIGVHVPTIQFFRLR